MADRNALIRKKSNSNSRSEASDAGSSSSKWDQDESITSASPVLRPAFAAQASMLPPSSTSAPAAHTIPAVSGSGTQPGISGADATGPVQPKSRLPLELHDGVLVINSINYDNTDIKDVLVAHPDIHSVLVQPEYVLASMVDLIGQFTTISTVTTLKFDFEVNALAGRCFSFNLDAQCSNALSRLLASNTGLTKLDFSGQRIFCDVLDDIALGLKQPTTLRVLDLTGDISRPRNLSLYSPESLGKMGGGIAAIISTNSSLSSILASYQSIDDEDAMLIAGALRKNTNLKTLVLGENKVEEKGCAAIFDAIRKNKHGALIKLDLSGCKIDTNTAKSIAKCLKTNTTLSDISIGTVPDTASLKIILEGLLKNKTLLTLHFCRIEDRDQKYSAVCQQLSVELQNRATRAATQPFPMTNSPNGKSVANKSSSGKEFS